MSFLLGELLPDGRRMGAGIKTKTKNNCQRNFD